MARQARLESETAYYHIMMRGNNREYIFKRAAQKHRFMEYLANESQVGVVQVAGWCLMDNHVHMVLRGSVTELAQAIKRINIRFAMGFNTQEGRIGHVFQDRFKSEPIRDDTHLLAVIRYVHNNPLKAGLVRDAGDYPWSSYGGYMEASPILSGELRERVLGYFEGDKEKFRGFHNQQDDEEYLEIKEDLERHRLERAQEIIAVFSRSHGLTDQPEYLNHPAALDKLIAELLEKSRLSYRKAAVLLGVSYSRVSQARSRNDF